MHRRTAQYSSIIELALVSVCVWIIHRVEQALDEGAFSWAFLFIVDDINQIQHNIPYTHTVFVSFFQVRTVRVSELFTRVFR